jgi:hypothetical protein
MPLMELQPDRSTVADLGGFEVDGKRRRTEKVGLETRRPSRGSYLCPSIVRTKWRSRRSDMSAGIRTTRT